MDKDRRREELLRELASSVRTELGRGAGPRAGWRGRVFPAMVALVFLAVGVGALAAAPVLRWDCERDAWGAVSCRVTKRIAGVVPMGTVTLSNILAATVGTHQSRGQRTGDAPYSADFLVVACADGTRYSPYDSSSPLGASHSDVARGITDLREDASAEAFRAWQGETVPLIVGAAFLIPMAFVLALVVLRLGLAAFLP